VQVGVLLMVYMFSLGWSVPPIAYKLRSPSVTCLV